MLAQQHISQAACVAPWKVVSPQPVFVADDHCSGTALIEFDGVLLPELFTATTTKKYVVSFVRVVILKDVNAPTSTSDLYSPSLIPYRIL